METAIPLTDSEKSVRAEKLKTLSIADLDVLIDEAQKQIRIAQEAMSQDRDRQGAAYHSWHTQWLDFFMAVSIEFVERIKALNAGKL